MMALFCEGDKHFIDWNRKLQVTTRSKTAFLQAHRITSSVYSIRRTKVRGEATELHFSQYYHPRSCCIQQKELAG